MGRDVQIMQKDVEQEKDLFNSIKMKTENETRSIIDDNAITSNALKEIKKRLTKLDEMLMKGQDEMYIMF